MADVIGAVTPGQAGRLPFQRDLGAGIWNMEYVLLRDGVVVDWERAGRQGPPPPPLNVEEACSGMRLLMTMTALGVAMAFVNERQLWQRLVMILACGPIAVLCNVIRVTTTGFFTVYDRPDLARGVPHTLLGLGMLVIAFSLYALISHVLSHLFVEGESDEEAREVVPGGTVQ